MSRISITEVARVLGISRPTARKRLATGEIPGRRLIHPPKRYGVDRQVFEKWHKSFTDR